MVCLWYVWGGTKGNFGELWESPQEFLKFPKKKFPKIPQNNYQILPIIVGNVFVLLIFIYLNIAFYTIEEYVEDWLCGGGGGSGESLA